MQTHSNRPIYSTLVLTFAIGFTGAFAQPPENRGKPEAHDNHTQHPGKQNRGADHDASEHEASDRYYERDETHGRGDRDETRGRRDIDIDEVVIREIFRDLRSYTESSRSLPPGIQKNVAQGKPLPPGIAKQFDSRVQSSLPSYPGYDWRQVGTDAVLIDVTTGIVEAIIGNVVQ